MVSQKVHRLKVIEAGLSRFFDEGYAKWTKERFEALIGPDLSLNDSEVVRQLLEWERAGFIRFDRSGEYLVTVLRPRSPPSGGQS